MSTSKTKKNEIKTNIGDATDQITTDEPITVAPKPRRRRRLVNAETTPATDAVAATAAETSTELAQPPQPSPVTVANPPAKPAKRTKSGAKSGVKAVRAEVQPEPSESAPPPAKFEPRANAQLKTGRVEGHRDGHGFLVPDDGSALIWLSPQEMRSVMHGDLCQVMLVGVDRKGRAEGRIDRVVQPRRLPIVGRLHCDAGVFSVVPEDVRLPHSILIPVEHLGGASLEQVVVVELLEAPQSYRSAIGRVVEVLGGADDPGMEIEIAVRQFDVPHVFSEAALALTAKLPDAVRDRDVAGKVDLRDVPLVTIDGVDARDFDDAVYCEPYEGSDRSSKQARGGYRLLVAIADVSHYVQDNDALDADAYERGTSVYFPRRVVPMLPEKLSNGLCSLKPEVERLAVVCDMVISAHGEVKAYQFYEAVICSAARLTYDEVWEALSQSDSAAATKLAPQLSMLRHLHALYERLAKARAQRGAIAFESTETFMQINEMGRIEAILPRTRNDAHKLIEECMLAANTAAADFIQRAKHPALYRVHEGPTPERLEKLRQFLRTMNLTLDGGDTPSAQDYSRLTEQIQGRPDAPLLQTVILRSMQQARYDPENVGHFGLAYRAYTHFTSPIRRYPDLMVHRVIKHLVRAGHSGGRGQYRPGLTAIQTALTAHSPEYPGLRRRGTPSAVLEAQPQDRGSVAERTAWQVIGEHSSACERRADEASRDVLAWLKCQFMSARVGEQFAGRITGVAGFGLFVTLESLYVEGMIHVSELGGDYFQYNEAAHELRGERTGRRYRLCDDVNVVVARVDMTTRRIEFRLVRTLGAREVARSVRRAQRAAAQAETAALDEAAPTWLDVDDAVADSSAETSSAPSVGEVLLALDAELPKKRVRKPRSGRSGTTSATGVSSELKGADPVVDDFSAFLALELDDKPVKKRTRAQTAKGASSKTRAKAGGKASSKASTKATSKPSTKAAGKSGAQASAKPASSSNSKGAKRVR